MNLNSTIILLLQVIMAVTSVVILALVIYFLILSIKALKIYLNK